MKEQLNYSTKMINANFRIKVNGIINGKKINTLVGVAGAIALIGGDAQQDVETSIFKPSRQMRLQIEKRH